MNFIKIFFLGIVTIIKLIYSFFKYFFIGLFNTIIIIPKYFVIGIMYIFKKDKKKKTSKNQKRLSLAMVALSFSVYLICVFLVSKWSVQGLKIKYLSNDIIKSTEVVEQEEKEEQNNDNSNNANEELAIRFNRTGREVQALEELGAVLGLPQPPQYIEAYDISNLSSTSMVCGMVVFENGRPLKKAYKRFRMKEHVTQDDYACMKEALTRRLKHYLAQDEEGFSRLPDLILLDGGQGHVNTIAPVISGFGLHIPVFGMVKDQKHRTRAISSAGGEISLSANRSAFHLLTQIQDEVHRYSVAYMHSIHVKSSYQMELTKVRGIGEKKAQKLLLRFKTLVNLKQATLEELETTAGINRTTAEELYGVIQEMTGGNSTG